MSRRAVCWLALALVLLSSSRAGALELAETLHFRQLNESLGLTQGTVRAMAQDGQGFVWLGTQDGLFRFDGQSLLVHRRSDAAGLPDNHILSLYGGSEGLWIGTNAGGLVRLGADGRFHQPLGLPSGPLAITALAGSDAELYAAIAGIGLARVQRASGQVQALVEQPAALRFIQTLAWRDGLLVLGCRDGLWLWPAGQDAPTRAGIDDLGAGGVTALAFARDGRIWVGLHQQGVRLYDPRNDRVDVAASSAPELTSLQVRSLLVDRRARLWVGTEDGLNRYDPSSGQTLQTRHDADSPTSLPANRLPALFEDSEGLVWVGSWTNGAGIYRPDSEAVRLFRRFADNPASLPANPIRALLPEADGTLWLGVLEQGGLVHFDPELGVLERFRHDPADPGSLPDDRVEALLRRQDGSLWVGTGNAGLAKLEGGRFTRYQVGLPNSVGLPGNRIGGLYEDHDQTLWVGLIDYGLVTRCRTCQRFSELDLAADSPVQQVFGRINQILRTRDGIYWFAGMPNGLYRYDPLRRWLTRYLHRNDDPNSISHDSITVLVEDKRGRLWVGTQGGGLILVTRNDAGEAQSFKAYTRADGLSGDAVGGLLEAPDGALWAATIDSISRLDLESGQIRSLDASFGEIARGYFIGASAIGADGVYYFGGLRGITTLRPELMPPPRPTPAMRITELYVDYLPYRTGTDTDTATEATAPANLELAATVNSVGFEFAALEFLAPESLSYEYRLLGLEEDWISAPASRRFAGFTRLEPGEYRFEVRALRSGAEADYEYAYVDLTLLPPWWATSTAAVGYVLAATVLIGASGYSWRRRRRRDQAVQDAIRMSEERLKFALWGSGDELWDIDLQGQRIHRDNVLPGLKISRMSPRSAEEFMQQVHPEDREASEQNFQAHVSGATSHYEAVYRTQAEDGEWRWLLARGRAVQRDDDGKATRVAGTVRDITENKANEDALKRFADELESRVESRTADHRMAIAQLKRTVQELTMTQKQLVESEKMASLGQLVAGVAHEINTPIGIGVTAASHLQHETDRLVQLIEQGRLGKTDLQQYTDTARDSAVLLLTNLARASDLIRSFKQVAVDQSSEQKRRFSLRQYLDETLLSLLPKLKRTKHLVHIECPASLRLETYPGALYQIVVNLLMNSLIHGLDGIEEGKIWIEAEVDGDSLLLRYRDNGRGMDESVRARIFDPFFTTKRQEGGSGLGMHLVYNLITQLLKGSIECRSGHGEGVEFLIAMPGVVLEGEEAL